MPAEPGKRSDSRRHERLCAQVTVPRSAARVRVVPRRAGVRNGVSERHCSLTREGSWAMATRPEHQLPLAAGCPSYYCPQLLLPASCTSCHWPPAAVGRHS